MPSVLGLILAGGKAERFGGGDKCLQPYLGRPLLSHIQERLKIQTDAQALSANGDPNRFAKFSIPVLADRAAFQDAGPIGGLLSGLSYAQANGFEYVLAVPGDAPLFPTNLCRDLFYVLGTHDCARAESSDNPHPVFALWRTACVDEIEKAATNRTRALWRVQKGLSTVGLVYNDEPYDPFLDADTPDELAALETIAAQHRID
jgi:molybdenum cofactor guanylyltransferase